MMAMQNCWHPILYYRVLVFSDPLLALAILFLVLEKKLKSQLAKEKILVLPTRVEKK
jgi:hypothetical protein